MGIIGQTHGVSKAANPQISPLMKMLQSDAVELSFSELKVFNSSITGCQSKSLSTLTFVEDIEETESAAGLSVSFIDVISEVLSSDSVTTKPDGKSLDLNENSTGSGGVQVLSSHA